MTTMNGVKVDQASDEAQANPDALVRYCPECGLTGPIRVGALSCCPDSCGLQIRRWQADKLERKFAELRSLSATASTAPLKQPDASSDHPAVSPTVSPQAGSPAEGTDQPDEFTAGVNAAAEMLDKMADEYAYTHARRDWETGVLEFGNGPFEDHYNTLRELADATRTIVHGNAKPGSPQ